MFDTRWVARTMMLTGLFSVPVAGILALEPAARADDHERIVGTWLNDVTIESCGPAPHVVFAKFQSLTSYLPGGILIEGGSPPGPSAVSRSAGMGTWERTGHHTLRSAFQFRFFDGLGRLVSIGEVKTMVRLIMGDNPATPDVVEPYYLSGPSSNLITNIDPSDGSVISVTEGCSEATSRPLLLDD